MKILPTKQVGKDVSFILTLDDGRVLSEMTIAVCPCLRDEKMVDENGKEKTVLVQGEVITDAPGFLVDYCTRYQADYLAHEASQATQNVDLGDLIGKEIEVK